MKTWTIDEMLSEEPCAEYDRERITALWAGRESLTVCDILALDDVPAADRVWVACRSGALDPALRRRWVEVIVTRAVTTHALHCGVPAVEQWAAKWLDGTDRTEAAARAAERAARAAERAAWAAAGAAAWAAAGAAAWAAAWVAAGEAERDRQVADLVVLVHAGA